MTSDLLLVLIFGIVTGFCLGWMTKWREYRRLEHHGVSLAAWDAPMEYSAAEPKTKLRSA